MLSTIFKFIFAAAILFWLFTSGKLDFSLISKSISEGGTLFYIAPVLLAINIIVTGFRWKLLLEIKSQEKISFKKIVPIHWIGLFFSTFLPGVVTGDVLKLLYVKDLNKNFSKTFLFTSVLVDRVLGLTGLLFLSGIITAISYDELIALSPKMKPFIQFNTLLGLGALAFLIGLFLPAKLQTPILNKLLLIPVIGKKVKSTFESIWLMGRNKKQMIKCVLISIVVQFIGITTIWILTSPFYGKEIPLLLLFGFIPIGLITIAIPISPAGAGIGHVIFDTLFGLVGVDKGASLFNIFFIVSVLVNLLGVFPYLLYGKKHSIEEAQEFEEADAKG